MYNIRSVQHQYLIVCIQISSACCSQTMSICLRKIWNHHMFIFIVLVLMYVVVLFTQKFWNCHMFGYIFELKHSNFKLPQSCDFDWLIDWLRITTMVLLIIMCSWFLRPSQCDCAFIYEMILHRLLISRGVHDFEYNFVLL